MSWPQLAERHDVSERQARRVVEAWWAERPAAEELDPERIVRETLDAFAQDLSDLALLSLETRNDGVRLGAIKARGDVFRSRVEVLRTLNALPSDWQGWMQHNDARRLLERFMKTLDARDDVPADLLAELDTVLRSDSPQPALEAAA